MVRKVQSVKTSHSKDKLASSGCLEGASKIPKRKKRKVNVCKGQTSEERTETKCRNRERKQHNAHQSSGSARIPPSLVRDSSVESESSVIVLDTASVTEDDVVEVIDLIDLIDLDPNDDVSRLTGTPSRTEFTKEDKGKSHDILTQEPPERVDRSSGNKI